MLPSCGDLAINGWCGDWSQTLCGASACVNVYDQDALAQARREAEGERARGAARLEAVELQLRTTQQQFESMRATLVSDSEQNMAAVVASMSESHTSIVTACKQVREPGVR